MATGNELKSCPFCGHDSPEFERLGTPRQSCIVICGNCGARHESSDEGDRCGQSWNDRATLAAPPDPVAPDVLACLRMMTIVALASMSDELDEGEEHPEWAQWATEMQNHVPSDLDTEDAMIGKTLAWLKAHSAPLTPAELVAGDIVARLRAIAGKNDIYGEHEPLELEAAAEIERLRGAPAAPEIAWQHQAVAWLRSKAAEQAQTNQRYPRHAECYPSWVQRVEQAQRLANDLEREAATSANAA